MSRVAFISDIHFGSGSHLGKMDQKTGLNSRLLDFVKTFDNISNYLIENKINVLFIAGDIYKHRQPTPTQQMFFSKALKKLSDNKIHTYITLGNHDVVMSYGKAHAISVFESLEIPYINIVSELTLLDLGDAGVDALFLCMPYMNKQTDPYDNNEEFLDNLSEKIAALVPANTERRLVMVGHNILEGTSVAEIQPDVNILNEPTITVDFIKDSKVDAAFFGHVHEHKVINKNPTVVSLGSMEKIDFADANRGKYLTILDVKDMGLELVNMPSKDFCNIKINLEKFDGDDVNDAICEKLNAIGMVGKVVRLLLRLEKSMALLIDRDRIQKILNTADFSTGINYKFIVKKESSTKKRGKSAELTSISFMDDYLKRMKLEDDRIKLIKSRALLILDEISTSRRTTT